MKLNPSYVALVGLLAWPVPASGQVRASEAATISQTVDGTVITVDYSRPRTRGRSPIYGKVVTWGEVWTPGANWATTLDVTKDVTVSGHALPKGKYSVWMEVQPTEWTVILDPKSRQFHIPHPKPDSSQIRFPVTPDSVSGPDVLTWSFTKIGPTGATLVMAWAGRAVSLEIVVPPSNPITLDANLAPRYVGNYQYSWAPRPAPPQADSAAHADDGDDGPPGPTTSTWKVAYTSGMLVVGWEPPPFEEWSKLVLIKIGDDWFYPGVMVEGELFDVANDLVIEFSLKDGRATGFEIRGEDDEVIGSGVRIR